MEGTTVSGQFFTSLYLNDFAIWVELLDLLKVDFGQVHGIGFYDKIVTPIRRFSGDRLSFQRQTGEEDWQD